MPVPGLRARLARTGADHAPQVTDAQLLGMLEKVNEQLPKTGITVRRRWAAYSSAALTRGSPQINRRRPSLFEDD